MQIGITTMSDKLKTSGPKKNHRQIKLPPGTVLLLQPSDPTKTFKCTRCEGAPDKTGYEWTTRLLNKLPARCPHCSSPSWNKPRVKAQLGGPQFHCQYCNHDWQAQKNGEVPVVCPRCKRYNWNGKAGLPSAKPVGVK